MRWVKTFLFPSLSSFGVRVILASDKQFGRILFLMPRYGDIMREGVEEDLRGCGVV